MGEPSRIPLVYVAGPYRGKTAWDVEQNIRRAEALGIEVARLGAYPVIPHTNTRAWFSECQPDAWWLAATLTLMRRCDAVIFTRDWDTSSGARAEHSAAVEAGTPVFYTVGKLGVWLRQEAKRESHWA